MSKQQKRSASGRYKLTTDKRGRIVCVDQQGKKQPLGRCVGIDLSGENEARLTFNRRKCQFDPEAQRKLEQRAAKKTVYAWIDEDDE